MTKPVLLCWNYERKSWVSFFEKIFAAGDYCFLNYAAKEMERECLTDAPVYYWNDFKNVDDLIAVIKPAKVIFMGLESPYTMLLNYACRQKKIKTFYLQHGVFHSLAAYRYEEKSMRSLSPSKPNAVDSFEAVLPAEIKSKKGTSFLKHSFSLKRMPLYSALAKFLTARKLSGSVQYAQHAAAGNVLQTDRYIVYTKYLSRVLGERDKVKEDKILEIGNDEANSLIFDIQQQAGYSYTGGDYYLFIDEAFSGSEEFNLLPIVSPEKYNAFLTRLGSFANSKGFRLKVKLHPFSYKVSHLQKHENIDYVRDADMAGVIGSAAGIFGFSSTLLIPALFTKPACIFKLNDFSDIHAALEKMNYCRVLDFHNFSDDEVTFTTGLSPQQEQDFIKYFLYRLDGKCLDRLQRIIA